MGKSDTALLRKELAKIVKESKIYQKKTDKIINELTNKLAQRDAENDLLRLALADRDRRIAFYENPNAPSSTDSMYTAERAAFRKQMNEDDDDDDDESGGGPESDDLRRKGPPKGHPDTSHNNRAEKTITLTVTRCKNCNGRCVSNLPPKTKLVTDFADNGAMKMECIAYVIEKISCHKCSTITSAPDPTLDGTSFGPKALGFILEYYAKRSTDSTIAYYFRTLYGFAVTPNTIWNARKAIAAMFGDTYKEILNKISEGAFVQFDESPIKINGKKGYVWVVTTTDATYLVVSPSRGAAVLDMHFAPLLNMPVVVDGYNAYNMFDTRQRCWIHLLRDAEKYAIRNRGNDLHCYLRLRTMYKHIKDKESASCVECLDLQNSLLQIAYAYGSSHKVCKKLENAAPHMFTFLRYPGMPPHNNAAELEIRDAVVLQRNVRHQLSEPGGMHVFSVLISIARTCHKQGIFPRVAVENMVMNSNWSPFEPPDQCQKKIPVSAVTA